MKREFERFERLKKEFDAVHGPKMEQNPDYGLEDRSVLGYISRR